MIFAWKIKIMCPEALEGMVPFLEVPEKGAAL